MNEAFCGICKHEVANWDEHVKTDEHQRNANNLYKQFRAFTESQGPILDAMKGGDLKPRQKGSCEA